MHRSRIRFTLLFAFSVSVILPLPTRAGIETPVTAQPATTSNFPFELGAREFQIMAGNFFSAWDDGVNVNFAPLSLRVGWMVSPIVFDNTAIRGTFEVLADAFGAIIYDGPGSALGGGQLHLRYNYVQPGARLVPYLQGGAGGIYSDASEKRNQRLIGSEFEFCIQAGGGLRWLINEHWALNGEVLYIHISNANFGDRNLGLNAFGGMLGLSFFF